MDPEHQRDQSKSHEAAAPEHAVLLAVQGMTANDDREGASQRWLNSESALALSGPGCAVFPAWSRADPTGAGQPGHV